MTEYNPDDKGSKRRDPIPPSSNLKRETDIFSSRSHAMDYFTVESVKLRTGYDNIKDWYLMVIQQLLENAVDFLQKHYQGFKGTEINVWITKDTKTNLLDIKIQNTNYEYRKIPVFTNIEQISNFEMKYGSKQNEKGISRGILGDFVKQLLALPHVIQHSNDNDDDNTVVGYSSNNEQWKYPLIIRHNGQETNIWVKVDIYNQTAKAVPTPPKKLEESKYNDVTEIEAFLPLLTTAADSETSTSSTILSMSDIEYFCRKYPLWTTDISFKFYLTCIDDGYADRTTTITYNATHPISSTWNNKPNVRYYKFDEFARVFTTTYDKKSISVYDILEKFRGGNKLKKTKEKKISIEELMSNPNYLQVIKEYYDELMEFTKPTTELSLPYVSDEKRKEELVYRLKFKGIDRRYRYLWLDSKKAFYKLIRGYYRSNTVEYPYAIEVLAIPYYSDIVIDFYNRPGMESEVTSVFLPSINYSFSIKPEAQNDVKTILSRCGFNFIDKYLNSHRNVPSVILFNIISPRPEYTGHDKSSIDISNFTGKIVEAAQRIQKGIPTCRAAEISFKVNKKTGENTLFKTGKGGKRTAISYVREFIKGRVDAIDRDPSLRGKGIGRITKQGTHYGIRPTMQKEGFEPEISWSTTREYMVKLVDQIVKEVSGGRYEREDLGIIAGARGMLYYRGEQIPIHFDNFREIAKKGVVVVIIEKEGLPDVLAEYAKDTAVALVNTRGHVVTDITFNS